MDKMTRLSVSTPGYRSIMPGIRKFVYLSTLPTSCSMKTWPKELLFNISHRQCKSLKSEGLLFFIGPNHLPVSQSTNTFFPVNFFCDLGFLVLSKK